MQASNHQAQSVVDGLVNEARVSTLTPNWSTVLCNRMDQGQSCYAQCPGTSPQLDPARRLKRPGLPPRLVGSAEKGRVRLSAATLSSRVDSLLYRWKAAMTVLVVLSFSFRFCKYNDMGLPCPVRKFPPPAASLLQSA